mmetsp:Transcript_3361/g.5090  ORF Transcript_3361/g.5090 Transcript_3361/m.5090 type:complete len:455 (-) Transcript_3361:54-1418(-)
MLLSLPDELVLHILSFLDAPDVWLLQRLCHPLNKLAKIAAAYKWFRVTCKGPRPCRINPQTAALIDTDIWVIDDEFPGKNGRWFKLDTKSCEWTRIACTGTLPSLRAFHTIIAVERRIWLFEGFGHDCTRMRDYPNIAFVLDIDTLVWSRVDCYGVRPSYRWAHAFTLKQRQIWVFGGRSVDGYMNDLHMFDVDTHMWHEVRTSDLEDSVAPVSHPSAPASPSSSSSTSSSDDNMSSPASVERNVTGWRDIYLASKDPTPTLIQAREPDGAPCPRARLTLMPWAEKYLVCVAGGSFHHYWNDVHFYDTEQGTWKDVLCKGSPPPPCVGHASVLVEENRLLMIGGVTRWQTRSPVGKGITADTLYELSLSEEKCIWSQIRCTGRAPPTDKSRDVGSLIGHIAVFIDSRVWVLGNFDGYYILPLPQHSIKHSLLVPPPSSTLFASSLPSNTCALTA